MKAPKTALLFVLLSLAPAFGYARPEEAPAPAGQAAGEGGYSRDSRGNAYYIDGKGALHVIENKVVVTDEQGNKRTYEVRGDERPWRDASGRLSFTDGDGRTVYIDEGAPGGVVDPKSIFKGTQMEQRLESGKSMAYCTDRLDACRLKCRELSSSDRQVCLGNCERDKERCDNSD